MNSRAVAVLVSLVLLAGVGALVWHLAHGAPAEPTTQPAEEDKPTATVKTEPLRLGEISQTIVAYGTVTAEPGAIAVYSVPIESRVAHVRVTAGQQAKKDDLLVEIEPSPDAKLQLLEARNGLDAAKKNLTDMQQRFDLKLGTNQDLMLAQQNVQSAQVRLENLQQRGVGDGTGKVVASADGLVSKVDVQEGQIVPAGGPLVELISRDNIEVKLGIEQSEVGSIHIGQAVRILNVGGDSGPGLPGTVHLIAQRVNPDTRLVDVFVAPETSQSLLLDEFVRVEIKIQTKQAMLVPREAVLGQSQQSALFVVKDGHAVKCPVKLGLENDSEVEVTGEQLKEGDMVVTSGNYELEDGMAVAGEKLQ